MIFIKNNGEEIKIFDIFNIEKLLDKNRMFYFYKGEEKIYYIVDNIKKNGTTTVIEYSHYANGNIHSGYINEFTMFIANITRGGQIALFEVDDIIRAKVLLLK